MYPGTKIVIASGVKNQARLIVSSKIADLHRQSYALQSEVKEIKTAVNNCIVDFVNGSTIEPVVANDNSRGYRANILIVDEYRLVEHKILENVLKPFLNVIRQPKFIVNNPNKYKHLEEPNYQIYLSSGWYKSHWSWTQFKEFFEKMTEKINRVHFAVTIPYQAPVLHNILKQSQIDEEKSSKLFDPLRFQMEYEGLFVGTNGKSFFDLESLNNCRQVQKEFIPLTTMEYVENQKLAKPKDLCNIPKMNGEVRLVSLDVAFMGNVKSNNNDSSVFTCIRLIPNGDYYLRQVVYIESIYEAMESENLAIRFKRLFYDFQSDFAIIDAASFGTAVYDNCAKILRDNERDVEYEPWKSVNDEALQERYKHLDGKPILYTIKASLSLNSEIALRMKNAITSKKLQLLVNDIEKRENLVAEERLGFLGKSPQEQNKILMPFTQTTLLINEMIALETNYVSAHIQLKEVGSATKDRYTSLAYANYIADELERNLTKEEMVDGFEDYMFDFSWKR
ncbi:terminase [Aerococcaceae bacterium zg-B36]|uniref:terminase n=1 Tax=Aerococcaceae bacterium zg-252 TaxID=2796928 RepID=UPI001BD8AC38|nr:terminase [Aerococcaceae bacterium zg-B36]